MSDDESEGEVPVCGSFEPQVWRKGYCRNCFHPGSKHAGGDLLIEEDRRRFGKENFHKKSEKSVKDQQSAEKGKPLKTAGQETGKLSDKLNEKKVDKQLDKEKNSSQSFKDKYEKLQKDKQKQDLSSTHKTDSEKISDIKRIIPEKKDKDSSKAIPPPTLPKTKGKGLSAGDKLKSKSTSDIREDIKSPVGNKLFKSSTQQDSLDKSKSKFGSAENVFLTDKKSDGSAKQKFGSAENLSVDKKDNTTKVDKNLGKKDGRTSDSSKPDYKSLLSSKDSKMDAKESASQNEIYSLSKDESISLDKDKKGHVKSSIQVNDSKVKSEKEIKSTDKGESKQIKSDTEESEKNKKGFKLKTQSKDESANLKSPSLEKEKPDFKTKFEKPDLKSQKAEDEKKDFKTKYEKPELKSSKTHELEKKDDKSSNAKPELKSPKADDREKADLTLKYEKPELKAIDEKDKTDYKSKHEKTELKTVGEKEKKVLKTKYEKPELKTVEEKEKKGYKTNYEKPELKTVEEKEKKDYKTKYEKPELKTVEEKEKKDFKTKYEKPELKTVEEKEKKDYKTKYEKPALKTVDEKEKKDFKTKYEKPELKTVGEQDKKDFKTKYEKPDLKTVKADDRKVPEEIKTKFTEDSKSISKELGDKSDSSARKWKPKTIVEEKDKLVKEELKSKNDKIGFKLSKTEEKEKTNKIGTREGIKDQSREDERDKLKSVGKLKTHTTDQEMKTKFERPELKSTKTDEKNQTNLAKGAKKSKDKQSEEKDQTKKPWLSHFDKDKDKNVKVDEGKSKYEKPLLKSVKDDDKDKLKKDEAKLGKLDLKSVPSKDNKFDFQKTLLEKKKSKVQPDSEKESSENKLKLDRQGLKSSKVDDEPKKDFKAKFDRPQLKSAKQDEQKSDLKTKYEKPELKSPSIEKREVKDKLGNTVSHSEKDLGVKNEIKDNLDSHVNLAIEVSKEASLSKYEEKQDISVNTSLKINETDSLKQEIQVNGEITPTDTKAIKSFSPGNNAQHLANLSSDADTDFDEPDHACAVISARSESPVHVDTQVFTSSRNKTAGVESGDSDQLTTAPQKGFSGSQFSRSFSKSPSREKSEEKATSKNESHTENLEKKSKKEKTFNVDSDVEKLKQELSKMADKYRLLEMENENLKEGLSAKESDHINLEKEKNEVESAILGLREQLSSMEDRCLRLESENSGLMTSLKKQEEATENQPTTEETEEIQDSIREREDICETLMEENEDLKQEIQDLKVEMEEMYDSFRDQEAEEFRELQKELEITAKNCRILQFKMRKAERRNEQLEDDRNLFEDKLRILQNQFENKDAVAHIKTLEQELKMAKDVSVRLHDELDLMDDKRTKVEEENRHLTELLEQADRKQFRLEIEVDKLRDQIIDLRQQLSASAASDDSSTSPRKVTMAAIERQSSQEIDVQQIKRELYDSKEREADLRDQLKFLEDDGKKMRKKLRDLEDENDNMSKHLKKMTVQHALLSKLHSETGNETNDTAEANIEQKVQYELLEEELSVLKKKMADLEEENEMLHQEMFVLEKKIKEKDHQLQLPAEPTSPNTFYEDKIKEYEKEADEFRWKILEKEKEIEQLYGQLKAVESRKSKGLRKTRSLDSSSVTMDSDYSQIVDLKRQLEFSQQESNVLRDKVISLEAENSALCSEIEILKLQTQQQTESPLRTLAVAYVDTENETHLRAQIKQMVSDRTALVEKIATLSNKCSLLTKTHYPHFYEKMLPTVPYDIVSGMHTCEAEPRDSMPNYSRLKTLTMETSGNDLIVSSNMAASQKITEVETRDPEKLLSDIDESFCVLMQGIVSMDSDEEKVVRTDSDSLLGGQPPDIPSSSVSRSEDDEKMSSEPVSAERDHLMDKILDLEEEVDDLRLIINTKEEKNISLEAELEDLESRYTCLQDDSRMREAELLQDLDMLHDKNEILSNLLDLVKERAESAEAELERVVTDYNEAQESSSESSTAGKSPTPSTVSALSGVSVGSDDVFDGSLFEKAQVVTEWETGDGTPYRSHGYVLLRFRGGRRYDNGNTTTTQQPRQEQLKKRVNSLEKLLAEERQKVSALEKKLKLTGSENLSSAMSDDVKLHMREKELLLSELQESQKHVRIASDQVRGLTDKLKRVESDKWRSSPKSGRRAANGSSASVDDVFLDTKEKESIKSEAECPRCAELQSVKDQLRDELITFKAKAEDLEIKVDEINEIWVSKSAASEREKTMLEQKFKQKLLEFKGLQDNFNKLKEEDRMKDIFLKERDNVLKEKTGIITRKEEIIQEQEEIIRQREEDLQSLLDQISQREKQIKDLTETIRLRDDRLKEKDEILEKLNANLEEKIEELHYLEEEVQDSTLKRKESETLIAEMQEQIQESQKGDKSEMENENDRLHADIDNLMVNITELHGDKMTLQNELDKAKHALSEAMLMWDRDRSTLGAELNIAREKVRMHEITANKSDSKAISTLRKEVHNILEIKEKLANELRITRMEHDNNVRILQAEKFKLTEELTSKIRMLTKEMSDNDKMSDELFTLRGQEDINYQLHHHEKILRAEYMAMKVRYETQLERLQKEHIQLLTICEKLQREKNLDQEIIVGIQKGMQNIRETYTTDLSRWKDERNILEKHISQIEEGKEIALHLRSQIDDLKRQLADQDVERTDLVNKMTLERKSWDIEKATFNSHINQLEEQLGVFIQAQSKRQDMQYRMEVTWEKEREEQKRLLKEAHTLTMDLQDQLQKREEEHARERKNLLEQLEKERRTSEKEKATLEKKDLEIHTGEAKTKHLEQKIEDLQEKNKKDQEFWMKEKGELLRRLATMRNVHNRDVRRTEDVLTGLKRLRELAALIIESDGSETLPSNGVSGAISGSDASAAASTGTGDSAISDIKQNIDQVILKYVKESLKQIHFAAEDLSRPVGDVSKEEKQVMRRSLSSSEIELLKDEFLIGSQETNKIVSHHEPIPELPKKPTERQHILQRSITHDASEKVDSESVPRNYVENILNEQSSYYDDERNMQTKETHKFTVTRNVTRTETQVMKLPKPPPSFIIPRSRSTSPAPRQPKKTSEVSGPLYKSISIDTSHQHRLSAPPEGATSRSSSADSSPIGYNQFIPCLSESGQALTGAGVLQTGSLDRLSPQTARRKFFEIQPSSGMAYMSWPERNRRLLVEDRTARSLSNSTDIHDSDRESSLERKYGLRTSLSMDDSTMQAISRPVTSGHERSKSAPSEDRRKVMSKSQSVDSEGKQSGFKELFNTVKRKLKPKLRRSHSAHVPNKEPTDLDVDKPGPSVSASSLEDPADRQMVRDRMEPIPIPEQKSKDTGGKERSRSKSKKQEEKDESKGKHTSKSVPQKLMKRFRSKSADRSSSREQQVHPILVGHSAGSQGSDSSWQFSETPV